MLSRTQLQKDLIAHPRFVTLLQAVTFNGRRVSIDEIIDWAHANWTEFADLAGIKEEPKTAKKVVTTQQGRALKSSLTRTLGNSVSVSKRGKYSFSVHAISLPDIDIREALAANECTITKTISGKFGKAGIFAEALLYIVSI